MIVSTERPTAHLLSVVVVINLFLLSACGGNPDEPSATEKALDQLQEKYDEVVQDKLEDPMQWAADDLENIGDWEYKVLDIAGDDPELLETTLNELGNDRWEVFWIESEQENFRVMLKRPSKSYLRHIPLSQIGRFVIGGSDAE